jgi:hypothetical protein
MVAATPDGAAWLAGARGGSDATLFDGSVRCRRCLRPVGCAARERAPPASRTSLAKAAQYCEELQQTRHNRMPCTAVHRRGTLRSATDRVLVAEYASVKLVGHHRARPGNSSGQRRGPRVRSNPTRRIFAASWKATGRAVPRAAPRRSPSPPVRAETRAAAVRPLDHSLALA